MAFRQQAEWWQPEQGRLCVQVQSSRFADAAAPQAEGASIPRATEDAPSIPQPGPPEELTVTLTPTAAPPDSAPEVPVQPSPDATEPIRIPASYVAPQYPEFARKMRFRARVLLRVQVTIDGSVGDVGVLETTRKGMGFERAAVDAVKQWRYQPATRGGKPEDAVLTVWVEFE